MNKLRQKETEHLRHLRTLESPKNYSTVKVIGKGAFGEVKLVQRKTDAKIYALKCLVKAEMFKKDQLAHVRAERDILAEADSPWVVKLHTTFQDKTFLYMLMEFLPGGDLMTMLIKYETFAPDIARFYMAEILLAIEAVHKLGFIHRYVGYFLCLCCCHPAFVRPPTRSIRYRRLGRARILVYISFPSFEDYSIIRPIVQRTRYMIY